MTKRSINTKAWRAKQRALGLCIDCVRPAAPNINGGLGVWCVYHRDKYRERRGDRKGYRVKPKFALDHYLHLPALDLAYVGALLDGEGYVGFSLQNNYFLVAVIKVSMVDPEPINFCTQLFGCNTTFSHSPSGSLVYNWTCGASRAMAVANAVLPYVKIPKKRQALLYIIKGHEFVGLCRHRHERDEVALQARADYENEIRKWHKANRNTRSQALDRYYEATKA